MPFYDVTCAAGHDARDVWASERPRVCATCGSPTQTLWGKSHGIQAVTWPGGKTFENLGHEPQTFYSPHELQRYCREHRLESFVRHVPVPGTDKSPHTTRWTAMSRETLEGAAAMLERASKASDPAPPSYVQAMTVTISEGA